jgi:hypothetical protein
MDTDTSNAELDQPTYNSGRTHGACFPNPHLVFLMLYLRNQFGRRSFANVLTYCALT